MPRPDPALGGGPHVLRQREPHGGQSPHLEEIAARRPRSAEQRPLARSSRLKFKHGILPGAEAPPPAQSPS